MKASDHFDHESLSLLSSRLTDFARFLRANQLSVDPGTLLDLQRLAALGFVKTRGKFQASARSCVCRCPRDWHRFDALFDVFWVADGGAVNAVLDENAAASDQSLTLAGQQRLLGMAGTSEKSHQEDEIVGTGDFKALSLADFRFVFDPRQMREIERLVERVARRAKKRVSRRETVASRGSVVDLRTCMRRSLRYAGQPVELSFRKRKPRLRRFVLLLDVSQSMDVYARLFMRFSRILMTVFQRSDAFVFNTDLSELGRGHARLSEEDFERVLNQLGKGWLGGTRIAQSLDTFNDKYLNRCVDAKTTVLIFSDGCDTASPDKLAERVKTIQRRAGKLVWVNPLLGRFEPGEVDKYMDPIVPYVDRYCSAHNLKSLIELERELLT